MKKVRLDLKDLRINSFDPAPVVAGKRGTVFGQDTCPPPTQAATCSTCDGWTCTICTTDEEHFC